MQKLKRPKTGQQLKKQLWKVFSEYIRRRDKGVCISCGRVKDWKEQDAGHYIPKTRGLSIYFSEQNVNCQCTYCNRFQHGNLSDYAVALKRKFGDQILEKLQYDSRQSIHIHENEYLKFIEIYKKKIKEL